MSEQRHAVLGIHSTDPNDPDFDAAHASLHLPRRMTTMKKTRSITFVLLAILGIGAAATMTGRYFHSRALAETTVAQARQFVTVIKGKPGGKAQPLTLPGTLKGTLESPIYARTSGYVLRWTKDIGSQVKQGEVLAEISTPEVDQQLSQAIAARQQAASSVELAKSSAERWQSLRQKDAVSQQELDERRSAYTQAQANLAAADANVRRLQQLTGFNKIVAPFAGLITRRNIEVGDLVDAGNGGASRALFTLAQVDTLRIYVYVPQTYAQRVKVGDAVSVTQAEVPGQVFHGSVARTAGAIDSTTRTMQIEIGLPNPGGKLLSGSYAQVALTINGQNTALVVPTNVLLFRPDGTRIAVVDTEGHVRLQAVKIGNDFGNTLEILSGITPQDRLVLNPADSLSDGDAVTVVEPQPEPATAKAGS